MLNVKYCSQSFLIMLVVAAGASAGGRRPRSGVGGGDAVGL